MLRVPIQAKDGTLILAAPTGAGQSNIEVNTEAGNTAKGLYLQFQSDAGPIENKISGDGVIRVAGEVSVKSSDISDYHGEWDVLGKLKTVMGPSLLPRNGEREMSTLSLRDRWL